MDPREYVETPRDTSQIPGLAYAFTDNGIKLPVLDITHPRFLSSIDEDHLDEVSKASIQKMLALGEMSDAQKKAYYEQLLKRIAGTIGHDTTKVHATGPALAKSTNAGLRFLGVSGLTGLLEKTGWRLERVQEGNPVYAVFTLRRTSTVLHERVSLAELGAAELQLGPRRE